MADTATTEPDSWVLKITLKSSTYEIDIYKLTGHERLEAKRLLEVEQFETNMLLLDEIGNLVLAYLAAKRMEPKLRFSEVLDLTRSDVTIDLGSDTEDERDPFGPSETPDTAAKTSSRKASSEA